MDWFLDKGHKDITVFVPAWRKEQSRPDAPITGTNSIKTFLLIQKQSWQDSWGEPNAPKLDKYFSKSIKYT